MKLFAICWRDLCEPWGWAPAGTGGEGHGPDALPEQTFFWDGEAAEAELERLVPRVIEAELPHLRYSEGEAVRRDAERREHQRRVDAGELPGVTITGVGGERVPVAESPPREHRTEEQLRREAESIARNSWSIQEYDVPDHPLQEELIVALTDLVKLLTEIDSKAWDFGRLHEHARAQDLLARIGRPV